MENKRVIKSIGEYIGYKEIDNIRKLSDFYYNLKDIKNLLNISKEQWKNYEYKDDIVVYDNNYYILQSDLKKIFIKFGGENAEEYMNRLIDNDESLHLWGYVIDDEIRKLEGHEVDNLDKYSFYDNRSNMSNYNPNGIVFEEGIPENEIEIIKQADLDLIYDKIYKD